MQEIRIRRTSSASLPWGQSLHPIRFVRLQTAATPAINCQVVCKLELDTSWPLDHNGEAVWSPGEAETALVHQYGSRTGSVATVLRPTAAT